MNISVTCRHATITEALKSHVHAKLSAVVAAYPQVEHVHAVLDVQRFRHSVEVKARVKNQPDIEARKVTDDMYTSIDQVADRLDRQLRRRRDKRVNHKGARQRLRLVALEGRGAAEP